MLQVYTIEGQEGGNYFYLEQERESVKKKHFYRKDGYFNQEQMNDSGEIIQIKSEEETNGYHRIIFEIYIDGAI